MSGLTRRRFLLRAAIAGAALVPAVHVAWSVRGVLGDASLADRIVRLFRHRESARRLGRAYLADRPEEVDPARLLRELAHLQREGGGATGRPDDLRQAVAAACTADFAQGRVVRVDGWILARTEARACALVALSA
jgi:hypothetical protein